jgi:hypothetical protein
MSRSKQASTRKHQACAIPLLSAAALSLSLANDASALPAGPETLARNAVLGEGIILYEEELTDVSLATFYVFDKENAKPQFGARFAATKAPTGGGATSGGATSGATSGRATSGTQGWMSPWACRSSPHPACGSCCMRWGRCSAC